MKRLATVAVMLAGLCCGAYAQRSGFHGGASGFRGGFSGSHMGFSGARQGFSSPAGGFRSAPAFRSGFSATRPGFRPVAPRTIAPTRFAPRSPSYPVRGMRPITTGPRLPNGTSMHRAPYHSSHGAYHYHSGYHYHPHNHVVFVNGFWPYSYWGYPYAYGYPYVWPSIFNDSDNYDSQPPSNYAAPQPNDNNVPYQPQPDDQQEPPQPPDPYPQQPNTSHRAPYSSSPSPAPSAPPVTLVFKDGRPPEQIYNYLLTANTLTVLDQNRRDIPVSQIDVDATAKANLQTGVNFALPVR